MNSFLSIQLCLLLYIDRGSFLTEWVTTLSSLLIISEIADDGPKNSPLSGTLRHCIPPHNEKMCSGICWYSWYRLLCSGAGWVLVSSAWSPAPYLARGHRALVCSLLTDHCQHSDWPPQEDNYTTIIPRHLRHDSSLPPLLGIFLEEFH